MLTRREVEGELRSLGFRARARQRRAERERAIRFVRGLVGVVLGVSLLVLIGVANFLYSAPTDLAFGHSNSRAAEWVGSGVTGASSHRASSLFFTGRRTWHPNDPRSRNRHRGGDD